MFDGYKFTTHPKPGANLDLEHISRTNLGLSFGGIGIDMLFNILKLVSVGRKVQNWLKSELVKNRLMIFFLVDKDLRSKVLLVLFNSLL